MIDIPDNTPIKQIPAGKRKYTEHQMFKKTQYKGLDVIATDILKQDEYAKDNELKQRKAVIAAIRLHKRIERQKKKILKKQKQLAQFNAIMGIYDDI